jgi:hypothetical protein
MACHFPNHWRNWRFVIRPDGVGGRGGGVEGGTAPVPLLVFTVPSADGDDDDANRLASRSRRASWMMGCVVREIARNPISPPSVVVVFNHATSIHSDRYQSTHAGVGVATTPVALGGDRVAMLVVM